MEGQTFVICRFCKFDNGDGVAFCGGCGADFTEHPRPQPKKGARAGRRIALWLGGLALAVVVCFIVFVLLLESEATQNPSVSEPSPVATQVPKAKKRPTAPAPAPSRIHMADDPPAGTLDQWARESYAARLTYSANYVNSRVRLGSIHQIKDTAVWLESCISKAARQGRDPATTVNEEAAACLAQIARRPN